MTMDRAAGWQNGCQIEQSNQVTNLCRQVGKNGTTEHMAFNLGTGIGSYPVASYQNMQRIT